MRFLKGTTIRRLCGLMAGLMTLTSAGLPVSAAEGAGTAAGTVAEETSGEESGYLALPSAGISYALSTQKVSLQDVEESLYSRGLVSRKHTAPAQTESVVSAAVSSLSGISADAAGTAQSSSDEVSAIMQTNLTPVQMKEQSLVKESSQTPGDVNESTATSLSAGAVSVVASTEDALARKKAEDAEAAAKKKAQEEAAKLAEQKAAEEKQAEEEAARKAEEEKKQQEENEQKAKENPLVVSTANDYVNVRKEPSEDSEIVGKLYAKDVGKVQEEPDENGWIKITSGSVTGYVKQDYVATGTQAQELAEEVGTEKAVVNTTTLLVRAAADPESDVIDLVGMGSALDIISEENGWYKVNTDVGEGYISSDFTDVEVEYPQAVSKEEEEAAAAARKAEEEAAAKAAADAASSSKSSGSTVRKSTTTSGQASTTTSSSTTTAVATGTGSGKGQEVVNYALQFVGNPYVWGGSSLTNGTDCSGFTMAVYAHFGVSLPHYDAAQRSVGIAVGSLSEAQPGDLICYYGHVGIYVGGGQIVHASNPRDGIKVSSASYRSIAAIRRIFY